MDKKAWKDKLKSLINIKRANELQIKALENNLEEMDFLILCMEEKIKTFK